MTALPGAPESSDMATDRKKITVKRIRIDRPGIRRRRHWPEDLLADPRDPDVVRAKTLARAQRTGSPRSDRAGR
jgi:hypothetical protein